MGIELRLVLWAYLLLAVLPLLACTEQPHGHPSLPHGLLEVPMPNFEANAFVYVKSPESKIDPTALGVSSGGVGLEIGEPIGFRSILGAITDFGSDYQLIVAMEDAETAAATKGAIANSQRMSQSRASVIGTQLVLEHSRDNSPTAPDIGQGADPGQSLAMRYPKVWGILQGFPDRPPRDAVATGFIVNAENFLDALFSASNLQMPGLSNGLGLLRTGPIVFVGYSDDLGVLPGSGDANVLHGLRADFLACARGGYPGFITELVARQFIQRIDQFESSAELPETFYAKLDTNLHVMIHVRGSDIFIAGSGSEAGVVELMRSVGGDS